MQHFIFTQHGFMVSTFFLQHYVNIINGGHLDKPLNLNARFDWPNTEIWVTLKMLQMVDTQKKFVTCNVSEVGHNATAVILLAMLRTTISAVDTNAILYYVSRPIHLITCMM